MPKIIKVAGIDPALTNTGIALGHYDIEHRELVGFHRVELIATEAETGKTVRKNSDDLRRIRTIAKALHQHTGNAAVIFAEIPVGAQSARAAWAFGMMIGMMGTFIETPGFKPVFIQVQPQQVKLSIPHGSKTTSKEEIVIWAAENWPDIGWKENKKGKFEVGERRLTADCEHMADACAAVNAGIRTEDFHNLLAAFRLAGLDALERAA